KSYSQLGSDEEARKYFLKALDMSKNSDPDHLESYILFAAQKGEREEVEKYLGYLRNVDAVKAKTTELFAKMALSTPGKKEPGAANQGARKPRGKTDVVLPAIGGGTGKPNPPPPSGGN
ncbi:MAG: hypothetical protein HQL66_13045, partial [Magnetococcales bacterium]|nr:hypothetical protein [Magnetococcales bacterium]